MREGASTAPCAAPADAIRHGTSSGEPDVQAGHRSVAGQTNRFGFTITWASDRVVVVEAASDVANPSWTPVSTNRLASS